MTRRLAVNTHPQPARRIVLEGERAISWNQMYSNSMHWSKRQQLAMATHLLVRASVDPDWPMYSEPVDITVTAYFKGHPVDASNIMAKVYEDGLKGRLIVDDSPAYVRSVRTVSIADKQNKVIIDIQPTGE